jgi:coenzyme F420-0:L-glutamate ligase/coenzyme F420-1:gamma-L-glutamate ligase
VDLHVSAVQGIPDVERGDDVAALIGDAVAREGRRVESGDVFVIAQKVISKAEGAIVWLDDVAPSRMATQWAADHGRDARVVEVILRESRRIVRMDQGILITETHHGFVCANAGVDASNVPPGFVTVLPRDPDASAEGLRVALSATFGRPIAIIVSDTFGRPWREGVVNVALGVAGLRPLMDLRGTVDAYGRPLVSTLVAVADELAGAAELVTRKSANTPVAIVRGAGDWIGEGAGRMLVRESSRDLFR